MGWRPQVLTLDPSWGRCVNSAVSRALQAAEDFSGGAAYITEPAAHLQYSWTQGGEAADRTFHDMNHEDDLVGQRVFQVTAVVDGDRVVVLEIN